MHHDRHQHGSSHTEGDQDKEIREDGSLGARQAQPLDSYDNGIEQVGKEKREDHRREQVPHLISQQSPSRHEADDYPALSCVAPDLRHNSPLRHRRWLTASQEFLDQFDQLHDH